MTYYLDSESHHSLSCSAVQQLTQNNQFASENGSLNVKTVCNLVTKWILSSLLFDVFFLTELLIRYKLNHWNISFRVQKSQIIIIITFIFWSTRQNFALCTNALWLNDLYSR